MSGMDSVTLQCTRLGYSSIDSGLAAQNEEKAEKLGTLIALFDLEEARVPEFKENVDPSLFTDLRKAYLDSAEKMELPKFLEAFAKVEREKEGDQPFLSERIDFLTPVAEKIHSLPQDIQDLLADAESEVIGKFDPKWEKTLAAIKTVLEQRKKELKIRNRKQAEQQLNALCQSMVKKEAPGPIEAPPKPKAEPPELFFSERAGAGYRNGNNIPGYAAFTGAWQITDYAQIGLDYQPELVFPARFNDVHSASESITAYSLFNLNNIGLDIFASVGEIYQRRDIKPAGESDVRAFNQVLGLRYMIMKELGLYAWERFQVGNFGDFNAGKEFLQNRGMVNIGIFYDISDYVRIFGGGIVGGRPEGIRVIYGAELGASLLTGGLKYGVDLWGRYFREPVDNNQHRIDVFARAEGAISKQMCLGGTISYAHHQKQGRAELFYRWDFYPNLWANLGKGIFIDQGIALQASLFSGYPWIWGGMLGLRFGALTSPAYIPWQPYAAEAPWEAR